MRINDLLVCTTNVLILLSNLFYNKKINFDVLKKNTYIKLNFLENSLDDFENEKDKELALDVLKTYKTIFYDNGCGQPENTSPSL